MSLFRIALIVLVATLGGCGLHLQGRLELPAVMQQTYIQTDDIHSVFYLKLRRELLASGVELVDEESRATASLIIYLDDTDQRVLSVSARNVPTEYEVYYSIRYSVLSGEDILLDVQDLTLTRDYTYDATLVLGKEKEEQLLRDAIAKDLVRIVLEQISAH